MNVFSLILSGISVALVLLGRCSPALADDLLCDKHCLLYRDSLDQTTCLEEFQFARPSSSKSPFGCERFLEELDQDPEFDEEALSSYPLISPTPRLRLNGANTLLIYKKCVNYPTCRLRFPVILSNPKLWIPALKKNLVHSEPLEEVCKKLPSKKPVSRTAWVPAPVSGLRDANLFLHPPTPFTQTLEGLLTPRENLTVSSFSHFTFRDLTHLQASLKKSPSTTLIVLLDLPALLKGYPENDLDQIFLASSEQIKLVPIFNTSGTSGEGPLRIQGAAAIGKRPLFVFAPTPATNDTSPYQIHLGLIAEHETARNSLLAIYHELVEDACSNSLYLDCLLKKRFPQNPPISFQIARSFHEACLFYKDSLDPLLSALRLKNQHFQTTWNDPNWVDSLKAQPQQTHPLFEIDRDLAGRVGKAPIQPGTTAMLMNDSTLFWSSVGPSEKEMDKSRGVALRFSDPSLLQNFLKYQNLFEHSPHNTSLPLSPNFFKQPAVIYSRMELPHLSSSNSAFPGFYKPLSSRCQRALNQKGPIVLVEDYEDLCIKRNLK